MQAVTRNGRILNTAFRKAGDEAAPVLAFSNSLGTDFRIWDEVVARLPADWGVLRYDTAGHGLSPSGGAMSIDDHAGDLAALLEAFDIDTAVVVGLSVGGLIAQSLALSRPERVAGLVLSNTGMKIGTSEIWNTRADAIRAGGMEAICDATMERWFSGGFRARQPAELARWRTMLAHTPADSYIALGTAIRDADYSSRAGSISAPTLCIAGSEDSATPPATLQALARTIPGARYEEIADIGHLPCVEVPERTAGLIAGFIREHVT
ncbi:3-oxoadipate enol-lactonase [Stappia sp. MMSF_3263]|uniref:3-oxoadipate enol-lactonase n=1 Tax=Stappia sp. MMSF_3263 TaxID=3046693 RepID=UPI00273F9F5F|nr:3-oxoadipate enol-lactonase [Stappia sp. MMSF_3263]